MKRLFTLLIFAFLATMIMAGVARSDQYGLVYHEIQVYDELGRVVTGISGVNIYLAGTTTNATIYKFQGKKDAITQQITTNSANTTLSNGSFYWWGPDQFDFTITDGTDTFSSGGRSLNASIGKLIFPLFLKDVSSTHYEDDESITLGTSDDWVINAGTTADLLTFTPATNGAVFRVGLANGTKCSDLQWYTAAGVGLLIDEGADTLAITGLTTTINHNSNYATSINTGTSTGAVTIGSSTAGAITVDTTSTCSFNSDGQMSLTTTDAEADIVSTSTLGRLVFFAGEDAADAILFEADGDTASTIRIFNDTGTGASSIELDTDVGGINAHADAGPIVLTADGATAGDITIDAQDKIIIVSTDADGTDSIYIHANGGTSEVIKIHSDQGTGAGSVYLLSDAGGITATATAGPIILNAGDASAGDTTITSADNFLATSTGKTDLTSAESITLTAPAINLLGQINLGAVSTFTDEDATPDVTGYSYWNTNTTTFTITDFDGAGIAEGQLLYVVSKGAITYDVTSSGLKGGTNDLVTASGDLTVWLYDGTDWILVHFTDQSDDLR